jgi:sodium/potassium-transporting ATPase subunit alpha
MGRHAEIDTHRAAYLRKYHPGFINVPTLIVDCVSVAIAFIPEGLPIALTASLTITANLMRKNKILCKSLKTVETLGSVSVICSDKTGTLTKVFNLLEVGVRKANPPKEQNARHRVFDWLAKYGPSVHKG